MFPNKHCGVKKLIRFVKSTEFLTFSFGSFEFYDYHNMRNTRCKDMLYHLKVELTLMYNEKKEPCPYVPVKYLGPRLNKVPLLAVR